MSQNSTFSTKSLLKYLDKYVIDWCLVFFFEFYIVFIGIGSKPFLRHFDITEPSINFPFHTSETVTDFQCLLIAAVLPLVVIFVKFVVFDLRFELQRIKQSHIHKFHLSVLGVFYSVTLTGFVVVVLKNWIGRPRPDFIGRCQPDVQRLVKGQIMYDISICKGDKDTILEGLRSNPSGHSALSFAGLNFVTVWLLNQFNESGNLEIWKILLLVLPDALATFVAISRTQDYRHHYNDVIIGGAIGLAISYTVFNKLFKKAEPNYLEDDFEAVNGSSTTLPLYND